MASVEKALQIAARAHEGQKDKDGQPYILHPLRVMNAVEGETEKVVAIVRGRISLMARTLMTGLAHGDRKDQRRETAG